MNNLGDLIGKEIKEAAVAGFCHQAVDSLAEPGLQISGCCGRATAQCDEGEAVGEKRASLPFIAELGDILSRKTNAYGSGSTDRQ